MNYSLQAPRIVLTACPSAYSAQIDRQAYIVAASSDDGMDWDTEYDTSLVSQRWCDPAELAGALKAAAAVPSLSDSLVSAQSTSPARKRKLFGADQRNNTSPGRSGIKTSPGRQLANLPNSKRARMSHSHPLARSSPSPPRQTSPFLRQQAQLHRSPSPVQLVRSPSTAAASLLSLHHASSLFSSTSTHHAIGKSDMLSSGEERTCSSCRRTATSLLQLAKFHKCNLCGKLSCPICSRSCQVPQTIDSEEADEGCRSSPYYPDNYDTHPTRSSQDEHDALPQAVKSLKACGKAVCRGCSIESHDGSVQCKRCHANPPQ